MAVTVTYKTGGGVAVGTTPPTTAQGLLANKVIATVLPGASADASATITHMMNVPAANITQGQPFTSITPLTSLAATSNWSVASQNPNFTVLAKNNTSQGGDTVDQIAVQIDRPHSITL